ncbi:LysR family transcriptional regulator [Evansella clarkii]|uniref:LysR family transcriptional regulator n=1 Tax=Evansella clarkii TaxID=79879 RepID=UPI0009984ABE|nr:LysR family transcriptional regulator [Evansella clarkii]
MELRQIEYFIEAAKREHITKAADAMHVAQSAVSRQINNLEEELGVRLFIREGRRVKLTPVGRIFLEHMKDAVTIIDKAKREVEEYVDPEKGTVRIGFPASMANYILPLVISSFRKEYPKVKFQLYQSSYQELMSLVIKGEIDIALMAPVPKDDKKLRGEILYVENIAVLLPQDHPLAAKSELSLHELRGEPFVMFPEGYILRTIISEACRKEGFQPEVVLEGWDIGSIKGLVSAGMGVTLLPEMTLLDEVPRSTVKIPLAEPQVTRNAGVIISRERELLPAEQLFYDFLITLFSMFNEYGQ